MIVMLRFRGRQPLAHRGLAIGLMLPLWLWAVGCARPAGLQSDDGTVHADQHPVPFHDGDGSSAAQHGDAATVQGPSLNSDSGLPFHDPQNLPAGTLLTVRLQSPISAENPGTKGAFEALLDEPVVIEGNRLIPRGVTVVGRVESAQASNLRRNHGYVRLALDSIHLAGGNVPIQTSSLFVRGTPGGAQVQDRAPAGEVPQNQASAIVIRLEKGRRLTFRLTEPVFVAASQRKRVDR
jgi:hypothetical protein